MIRDILAVVGIAVMLGMMLYLVYLGISNPDMAQGRLLLTFWPAYVLASVIGAASIVTLALVGRRK